MWTVCGAYGGNGASQFAEVECGWHCRLLPPLLAGAVIATIDQSVVLTAMEPYSQLGQLIKFAKESLARRSWQNAVQSRVKLPSLVQAGPRRLLICKLASSRILPCSTFMSRDKHILTPPSSFILNTESRIQLEVTVMSGNQKSRQRIARNFRHTPQKALSCRVSGTHITRSINTGSCLCGQAISVCDDRCRYWTYCHDFCSV